MKNTEIKELSALQIVDLLVKLSNNNPNDMDLGKVVRRLVKK